MLASAEVGTVITALGTGIGRDDFNIGELAVSTGVIAMSVDGDDPRYSERIDRRGVGWRELGRFIDHITTIHAPSGECR